jgi:predicted NACHT family NTPase
MKAYNLRNLESHQCKEWTNARLYDELRSVLIIYLYATYKHYNRLKIAVNPFDVTDYLKKEIQRVKSWQSRFVHIEGKENFNEIDLYAKEYFEEPCEIEDEGKENFSTNDKIIREGTIDHLRKSIEEKQMVIIGEVGMGKSTTLQYLLLKDAEESLKDSSKPTPIYFELKNLTEKDDLLKKIKERLGIDMDLVKDIMKRGALNLFFDGLNEIEKKVKAAVFSQIINMLNDYPNNSFIITCRPIHYNREFDNLMLNRKIPVFILQKMHDKQIEEFLDKNGKQVKQYILKEISNHDRLKRIIQTPLLLTMLIAVVIKEGSIPNEKGKIIRAFMNSLYDREQRVFIDFDKETFHLMLCYLGFQSRDLTGSNSGLDRDEYILPILEVRKLQLGLSINLLEFLKKSLELNVLVLEDNMYSFSHELYQEYYAAEYLHQLTKN